MRPDLTRVLPLLRAGDERSVSEALSLLQNTVYAFSMKVCGHRQDAEDTMQEVLMRSLPALARIDNPRALSVWLYTVTRNRCWRMRRKGADAARRSFSLDELMPDEEERSRLLADPAPRQDEAAYSLEQQQILQRAVLLLPPQYRIVLVLHDMEELDTAQVAEILELRPATVRVRLHRSRLALHKILSDPARFNGFGAAASGSPVSKPAPESRRQRAAGRGSTIRPDSTCRDLFANLSEYLDRRLESKSCDEMAAHIRACPTCVAFLRSLRRAIDRCRSLDPACDFGIATRLRTLLTHEYLRLVATPAAGKHRAADVPIVSRTQPTRRAPL